MLCFIFAALVVILDQVFKRWIMLTVELHGHVALIPGVIELTHFQNSGAAFSILEDKRWLLAGISLVAAVILIFILLRYTEGFWGTLGLSAVLGGTVGNLIDRVFQGFVVDMFRPLFINFAVFNVADMFLTLGVITFSIHFIATALKSSRDGEVLAETSFDYEEYEEEEDDDDEYLISDIPEIRDIPDIESYTDTVPYRRDNQKGASNRKSQDGSYESVPEQSDIHMSEYPQPDNYAASPEQPVHAAVTEQSGYSQPEPDSHDDLASLLSALESELGSIDDFDTDALLREYGFEDGSY
jgi:signal peptidase II